MILPAGREEEIFNLLQPQLNSMVFTASEIRNALEMKEIYELPNGEQIIQTVGRWPCKKIFKSYKAKNIWERRQDLRGNALQIVRFRQKFQSFQD